jgi:hypothetical protein
VVNVRDTISKQNKEESQHGGVIMPGFDRTGPFGAGPMTGGARGLRGPAAAGYQVPFYRGAGYGRGMGLGRGFRGGMGQKMRGVFGRGYGWNLHPYAGPYPYATDPAGELDMLKAQAESFKNSLEAIHKRMAELENSSK